MSDRRSSSQPRDDSSVEAVGVAGVFGVWQIALGEQTANFLGPDDESLTLNRNEAPDRLELACLPFGATTLTLKLEPEVTFTVSAPVRDRVRDWIGPVTATEMSRAARPISTVGILAGLILLFAAARGYGGVDWPSALLGSGLVLAGVLLRITPQPALAAMHVILMAATIGKSVVSVTQGGSLVWHGIWGVICLLVAFNLLGRARTLRFLATRWRAAGRG
jgi:hypothetical protein